MLVRIETNWNPCYVASGNGIATVENCLVVPQKLELPMTLKLYPQINPKGQKKR